MNRFGGGSGTMTIPALLSGGIMLTYRCTNRCKHCLYRCAPQRDDSWMTEKTLRQTFAALRREPLQGVHFAGGEATMRMDVLEMAVRTAVEMGIPIDYLETNGAWCRDYDRAETGFRRLRDAGLPAVLVSASLFHNEFVPFRNTRHAVAAARAVFGTGNVIVWQPHIYRLLEQLPDDRCRSLAETCRALGLSEDDPAVASSYGLIPGGRVCSALGACFEARPAEAFRGDTCAGELGRTSHFHIDLEGRLFTGFCMGVAVAGPDNYHPTITAESHPVFATLWQKGPWGLVEEAAGDGFVPRERGYISKCDLCLDLRQCLWRNRGFPELQPDGFYEQADRDDRD